MTGFREMEPFDSLDRERMSDFKGMKRGRGWGWVDEWRGGQEKEQGVGCGVSLTFGMQ